MHRITHAGINLVLVSRTESKLLACAAELTARYPGVEARVCAADLTRLAGQPDTLARLAAALEGLEVSRHSA